MDYPVGADEQDRLAAVEKLRSSAPGPDPALDRVCKLAKAVFGVPVAVITLVGRDYQWFAACDGLPGATGTPRSHAFCNYTILSDEVFVVEDACRDPRFARNPLVVGEPRIRFYAGAPLALDTGRRFGSLCLVGFEPRTFSAAETEELRDLAGIVVTQLELYRSRNEAKAHRDALVASEERLRLAVETTGLGSWEYAAEDGSFSISPEGLAMAGVAPGAKVDLTLLLGLIHPGDRQRLVGHILGGSRAAEQSFRLTVRVLRPSDHQERRIEVSGRKAARGVGRVLVGTLNDITDLQVRAQQQQGLALLGQIALQDADLNGLFQASCDIVARTLGADLACVAVERTPGTPLATVVGAGRLARRRQGAQWDQHTMTYRAFKAHDTAVYYTADDPEWQEKVGRPLGLQSAMAVGIGDNPRRFGALSAGCARARRFTPAETSFLEAVAFVLAAALERRQAVDGLRLRDRALEAVGQGIAICDAVNPTLPVIYVNPALQRQTGWSAQELVDKGSSILLDPGGRSRVGNAVIRQLETEGQFAIRISGRSRDGRLFHNDVNVTCVRDGAGRPTHYVSVHTDITHKLRLENEARQTQKMDAIGKLTGGVAHDFNNLLTVILGNAEIIAEMTTDPELQPLAEMVVQAAERGADTVQRLLAFGRRQDLLPETLNVNDVVGALTNLLKRSVGEEVMFRTRIEEDTLLTRLDKSQLETALLNLVVNARDAMPRGGVVTLRTRSVVLTDDEVPAGVTSGAYVCVSVTDTGCGMPPEILDRVFEPFFTTKEVGKGTGLGLSMVYGFAQQSGGYARICSEVGRGTSVDILLPRLASDSPVVRFEVQTEAPARGRERILVVEDQDDVRTFVTSQLMSLGYDVSSVPDGPTALHQLETGREVALLFTDVIMPGGLDGIQLAEKALLLKPDLKVLFTSGYTDLAAERSSRFLDGNAPLLKKPYRRSELSGALRAALAPSSPEPSTKN